MEPEKIGRYEIRSKLGEGGMAAVYLGYDPLFDRKVAIKILPTEFLQADPRFQLRFKREAKFIAHLEHSSIVPVYDVGDENGQPYLIMQYMRDGTLLDRIREKPLGLEESINILEQIAPGIDEAHAQGIIHRDLKPSNILFDNWGNPKVADFGIAKLIETQNDGITKSDIIGTPAYMSPEQVMGYPIDGYTDIYALGIVFYEMLTGKLPQDAYTRISHSTPELVPNILDINPTLPLWVLEIISKAMAMDKSNRFATAGEMISALNAFRHSSTRLKKENKRKEKRSYSPVVILSLLLFALIGTFGILNNMARTPLPISTATATVMSLTPTRLITITPSPSPTLTATVTLTPIVTTTSVPSLLILGGADKIAFLKNNNIWVMNLDGKDLQSVTKDKTVKTNIEWLPDGKTILYIADRTIKTVNIETAQEETITSFGASPYFEAFRISPDGKQVAISLARELYVVPFDLEKFKHIATKSDLLVLNGCHYTAAEVEEVLWSRDGEKLAIKFAAASVGNLKDYIRIIDIHLCRGSAPLPTIHQFPESFFPYRDDIIHYDWNGESLFFLNDNIRNDGFGYLSIYNSSTFLLKKIAPIDDVCCYRDATFSPDGTYVLFAFQDMRLGDKSPIVFYYLQIGLLEANANFKPIPLPEGFFTKRNDAPMPVLRPALK